jgi:predicted AAA+ superfamily ATPase
VNVLKQLQKLQEITRIFNQLIIFRSLKQVPEIAELLVTIEDIEDLTDLELLSGWYGLILEQFPAANNPWAEFLSDTIKQDENYFSLACEQGTAGQLAPRIVAAVQTDLKNLNLLLNWNPESLITGLPKVDPDPTCPEQLIQGLTLTELAGLYKKGSGLLGKYSSFTWESLTQTLSPIESPDPVTFSDLIGIENQKKVLLQNTIQFIKGYPANNILLYGDRGTGKSSAIKALNNWFAAAGLRVIEVNKEDLTDFPIIIDLLKNRGLKFILYVDDLSFEAAETGYKHLKVVLEGGLAVKPANVLIYATSNRRHLIKETFEDREDDLHGNDAIQERLSLADRFGITLTFTTPNQPEYLEIVTELAQQHGIALPPDELAARANQWELQHNGRSGRTAKQFIDQLQGELGMRG